MSEPSKQLKNQPPSTNTHGETRSTSEDAGTSPREAKSHQGQATPERPDVFAYDDYRIFLRDARDWAKATQRGFSYRRFSARAGVKSPAYLKMVIDGQRKLLDGTARGFAKALGLRTDEARYFVELVAFNQAEKLEDQQYHYERLARIPKYREARRLEVNRYHYYRNTHVVVVREMVAMRGFREDPHWIAAQLIPRITPAQAQQALDLLLDLGLIQRSEDGKLRQAEPVLATAPQLEAVAVRSFHHNMLDRCRYAVAAEPIEHTQLGGVTLKLTESQVARLKELIYSFDWEVLGQEASPDEPARVYHFAHQLYPVTQLPNAPQAASEVPSKVHSRSHFNVSKTGSAEPNLNRCDNE